MWIISKRAGVINSATVTRFTENHFGTHAHFGATTYTLTDQHVLATIIDALKNNQDFLEVE